MKQPLVGGRPQELAPVPHAPGGASWGPDGTIVYATAWARNGLHAVSEDGSETRALTEPDQQAGELFHRWPQVLPDGDSILFTVSRERLRARRRSSRSAAAPGSSCRRFEAARTTSTAATFSTETGRRCWRLRFDLATRRVDGPPVPLLGGNPRLTGRRRGRADLRRDLDPGYLGLLRAAH